MPRKSVTIRPYNILAPSEAWGILSAMFPSPHPPLALPHLTKPKVSGLILCWNSGVPSDTHSVTWIDPLEKEMAIHSSTIAWKISWTEEPGRLQSMVAKSRTRLRNFTFTFIDTDRYMGFPGGSVVKNPPAVQDMQVWSLDRKDPLEKEMATHSTILAWRIPWTEDPGGLLSMGSHRVGHDWGDLAAAAAVYYSSLFIL